MPVPKTVPLLDVSFTWRQSNDTTFSRRKWTRRALLWLNCLRRQHFPQSATSCRCTWRFFIDCRRRGGSASICRSSSQRRCDAVRRHRVSRFRCRAARRVRRTRTPTNQARRWPFCASGQSNMEAACNNRTRPRRKTPSAFMHFCRGNSPNAPVRQRVCSSGNTSAVPGNLKAGPPSPESPTQVDRKPTHQFLLIKVALMEPPVVLVVVDPSPSAAGPAASLKSAKSKMIKSLFLLPIVSSGLLVLALIIFAHSPAFAEPGVLAKADRLPVLQHCSSEVWPRIAASCLRDARGMPVGQVRQIKQG